MQRCHTIQYEGGEMLFSLQLLTFPMLPTLKGLITSNTLLLMTTCIQLQYFFFFGFMPCLQYKTHSKLLSPGKHALQKSEHSHDFMTCRWQRCKQNYWQDSEGKDVRVGEEISCRASFRNQRRQTKDHEGLSSVRGERSQR